VKSMECKHRKVFIFLSFVIFSEAVIKNLTNMKRKIFIVTAGFIISSHVHAQLTPAFGEDSITSKNLEEVVVTANKYPRKQNETGKVITVIGKEVLECSTGKTVADVLNQQAALVVIGSQNGLGLNQDLYLRGSGKVLLLIDGVPAYDASSIGTAFDFNQLSVENIERIEILKGAQSTLYGSDAVAGVINIITKKGGSKKFGGFVNASAGSYGTFRGTAAVNGNIGNKFLYNVQYNHVNSKGFSSAYDSTGNKNFDKDGYQQNSIAASGSIQVHKKISIRLNGQYSGYTTDLDGNAFTDDKDFTANNMNYQAGLQAKYTAGKGAVYFNINANIIERKYLNDSSDISGFSNYVNEKYRGNSLFYELYTQQPVGKYLELVAGIDYRTQNSNQDYLSISSFGPYKTNIGNDSVKNNLFSAFASLLLKNMSGFYLELGGRYNKHSQYGNNVTYTFNPSYSIDNNWKAFINVSSAFKAPSLYQLFGPGVANRTLEAEKSTTYEGGLQFQNKKLNVRAVYFYRSIKDGIDYNLETFSYFNNNKQKDKGIELEVSLRLKKLSFNANYSLVTGEVNTWKFSYDPANFSYRVDGDTSFNNLFRRPKHAFNTTVGYQAHKKIFTSISLRGIGKRFEGQFDAKPIELKSYYTIDLYADYTALTNLHIFIDFRNITNQQFFDIRGYNSRRFNFMTGIRWIF
jgi:vitamin B12 transporter